MAADMEAAVLVEPRHDSMGGLLTEPRADDEMFTEPRTDETGDSSAPFPFTEPRGGEQGPAAAADGRESGVPGDCGPLRPLHSRAPPRLRYASACQGRRCTAAHRRSESSAARASASLAAGAPAGYCRALRPPPPPHEPPRLKLLSAERPRVMQNCVMQNCLPPPLNPTAAGHFLTLDCRSVVWACIAIDRVSRLVDW